MFHSKITFCGNVRAFLRTKKHSRRKAYILIGVSLISEGKSRVILFTIAEILQNNSLYLKLDLFCFCQRRWKDSKASHVAAALFQHLLQANIGVITCCDHPSLRCPRCSSEIDAKHYLDQTMRNTVSLTRRGGKRKRKVSAGGRDGEQLPQYCRVAATVKKTVGKRRIAKLTYQREESLRRLNGRKIRYPALWNLNSMTPKFLVPPATIGRSRTHDIRC